MNPVVVDPRSDLYVAQPITFETMLAAQSRAELEVSLLAAQFPEDRAMVPDGFQSTPDLERSARDITPRVTKRKLPFIKDILDRLYECSPAQYLIYSNVDIAVTPTFYERVADLIRGGLDAFGLNRQNISSHFTSVAEIPEMYEEVGEAGRSADTFVFRRILYPQFELDGIFIGEPGVGRALLANLFRFGGSPAFLRTEAVTFHIGDDGLWRRRPDGAGRWNVEHSLRAIEQLRAGAGDDRRRARIQLQLDALEGTRRWLQRG